MDTCYGWAMRYAARILFTVSLILFMIGIGQALLALKNATGETMIAGQAVSARVAEFLLFLSGTFSAFGSAVLPFLGAVLIDRWDAKHGR